MRAFKSPTLLVHTERLLLRLGVFFTVREMQPSNPLFISGGADVICLFTACRAQAGLQTAPTRIPHGTSKPIFITGADVICLFTALLARHAHSYISRPSDRTYPHSGTCRPDFFFSCTSSAALITVRMSHLIVSLEYRSYEKKIWWALFEAFLSRWHLLRDLTRSLVISLTLVPWRRI